MVSVMNLAGYVVVGHGHAEEDIFTVISFHIIGMYSLVLVVGDMIDRVGRMPALVGGLVVMAVSALGLGWHSSVLWTSFCLFGVGLGWNVSYVAASAHLADVAAPSERGRLIGFTDLLSGLHRSGAGACRRRCLLGVRRAGDRRRGDDHRDRADPAHAGARQQPAVA